MSILFGIRRASGDIVQNAELCAMGRMTAAWAMDGGSLKHAGRIGMGLQPLHTHARSWLDAQPVIDGFGNMLTFDGRLDNYVELTDRLDIRVEDCSDSRIILEAFQRWGEACFKHFIGDWALALWSSADEALYLARDHAGTRTLYFEEAGGCVQWGTYLESFFAGINHRELDQFFVTRFLCGRVLGTCTPYRGIRAVPPAHHMRFDRNGYKARRHWAPPGDDVLCYRDETQYEEQFLTLFEQSVRRRIGTEDPVIAQLSGGMDSSAIVCMSDRVRHRDGGRAVPTLSFFDDSESSWNEVPYFSAVEKQRNQTGIHIPVSMSVRSLAPYQASEGGFLPLGGDSSTLNEEKRIASAIPKDGVRTILSGIGGDEMLGGSLTCFPELAGELLSLRLGSLFSSTLKWSLSNRTPLLFLYRDLFAFTRKLYLPLGMNPPVPPWVRCLARAAPGEKQDRSMPAYRFGHQPRTIVNALTWSSILETMPNNHPPLLFRYEYRFPFLDRDLVEYLFRVPLSQLSRPGRRRYMMRRALQGVVPNAVLERPRKGFVIRAPLTLLRDRRPEIAALFETRAKPMELLVDVAAFQRALDVIGRGAELRWLSGAMRTISLAIWMESWNGLAPLERTSAP